MELHNLKPAAGSTKVKKRLGRGQGSNTGGTAGRGHKGAGSRSGYKTKKGFEGGQMPLQRRVPKTGFKNINRVEYVALNLGRIQAIVDKHGVTDISKAELVKLRLFSKTDKIKVLATGDLTAKVNLTVDAISESAKSKVESLGGTITLPKA